MDACRRGLGTKRLTERLQEVPEQGAAPILATVAALKLSTPEVVRKTIGYVQTNAAPRLVSGYLTSEDFG